MTDNNKILLVITVSDTSGFSGTFDRTTLAARKERSTDSYSVDMSVQQDVGNSDPPESAEKLCKKCKMKVIDAYVKCSKCEELYHKSCHRQLIARGKKMITINDNIMLCEEHCREIHSIVETFHNPLKESKNEIIALKSKNVETIQTNNDIKNELELLQLQYTRLESSSERKIKILMDEVTALKLENDSYRRGNCE
ncbi:hypothetical protein Zmor_026834 [Zophobas morio]|uniref:Uncharacterized protein n=1 Tax=Zophobas morio TaxID=2755281 RepID=A0AA38HW31_9CUCU|nr:hypothetical protein Zmor_026834 [Zophobas morio]